VLTQDSSGGRARENTAAVVACTSSSQRDGRAAWTRAPGRQPETPRPQVGHVHPVLSALFADLERSALRWMLLRVPNSLAAPSGDVDLLVAPGDAAALCALARHAGFVAPPGRESPPRLLLMRYDPASSHWLVLDIVTTISYRSSGSWGLPGAAEEVLRRRTVRDGIPLPSDADAFWLLLLHCLLDKGRVGPQYRGRLRYLASFGPASPLGAAVVAATGRSITERELLDAALNGDTYLLSDLALRLGAELRRHQPAGERVRVLLGRLVAAVGTLMRT
jgi:hypothetical protein